VRHLQADGKISLAGDPMKSDTVGCLPASPGNVCAWMGRDKRVRGRILRMRQQLKIRKPIDTVSDCRTLEVQG
jgi:hypothetical protein